MKSLIIPSRDEIQIDCHTNREGGGIEETADITAENEVCEEEEGEEEVSKEVQYCVRSHCSDL